MNKKLEQFLVQNAIKDRDNILTAIGSCLIYIIAFGILALVLSLAAH